MWGLEAKDWVMVGATIAGPILAVQAQKWVERAREATNRRSLIFTTLMATRQSRISMEHVRALNQCSQTHIQPTTVLEGSYDKLNARN
ncbi:DUF6680 family protein [Ralstonia syzygii]|uniref:DUF6680 family protein n=1 Tax=Ralstonia syzygii TaxID=28097 RepID=UPI0036F36EBC